MNDSDQPKAAECHGVRHEIRLLQDEIERLGRCNEHISHTFSAIINQQNMEITRLRTFRDAVYENIVENAGGQFPYAYIWQARWDAIKAAESAKQSGDAAECERAVRWANSMKMIDDAYLREI